MNWLQTFRARRKLVKDFSKYVSPEAIKTMGADSSRFPEKKEARSVEFVWLWLDDGDEKREARVARAIDFGLEFGALTETIFPPIIIFWFGALPQFEVPDGVRSRFVEALRKEFGSKAKLYHGRASALVGLTGSKTRFTFGVAIDRPSALLSDLCTLQLGQYLEYEERG